MAEDQNRILFADDSLESKLLEAELAKNPETKAQKIAVQDRLKLSENVKNNVKGDNAVTIYLPNPSTDYNNEQFTNEISQVQSQYSPKLSLVKAYEFVSDLDIPIRALRLKIIPDAEARKLRKERFAKAKQDLAAAKQKYTDERLAMESEAVEETKPEPKKPAGTPATK